MAVTNRASEPRPSSLNTWERGDYRDIVVFALLALTLIFRPDGLFVRPTPDGAPGAGAARRV